MVHTVFFSHADAFSEWLDEHQHNTTEVWVQFYKTGSGKVSPTWPEAVDIALCFGWIDGLRKTIDSDSYKVRFTPRKKNSMWSSVNITKAETLIRVGRMRPEGLELFNSRKDSRGYSAQTRRVDLAAAYERRFKENQEAWKKFSNFAPSYRRDSIWWVMSAKREETRLKRLDILISSSSEEQRIPALSSKK